MLLLLSGAVLVLLYFYLTKNYSYWQKRNVKCDPPVPIFGNHFRNIFGYKSLTHVANDLYRKYSDEKVVGYYRGRTPELLIRDPDIIRQVLNVDFQHFYKRGFGRNHKVEPMNLNLFSVDGDNWKLLRQRLTSAFTTAKLKSMFPLVVGCAEKLQKRCEVLAENCEVVDVRELMARFTTEFIGACSFGIDMDTINNERSQFRELGKMIFGRPINSIIKTGLMDLFPVMKDKIQLTEQEVIDTMVGIFTKIREQRGFKPSTRHDFVDLLLELETKGKLKGPSIENPSKGDAELEMDIIVMTAQLFIFFAAGFETSSSATSYTLHQLAYNPEVQERVQKDIDRVMEKHNGKLCYDSIAEMTLLDMAFKESMRMFPSLGVLNRVCTRKYTIPDTDITIDPGVKILIPIEAIQNDEKYFDNPQEFRPERFSPEEHKNHRKYTYLPFGDGPRACIGERLGHMQSLAGLAALLHKFRFEPGPTSKYELDVQEFSNVVQSLKGGVPLVIRTRAK